ncbi:hypothetical protein BXZ70DRAFT_628965 [Cristinia sonorae]|uniref:Uncharacterized protein n=1 Tax=Cristinia sonorae TaxID=1940300 RepID=A0A8K0XKJ6_9AGAR|nr:hypothetical protein BXZ70DRAFT_628965 [Cristinia sonorae]
MSSHPASLTPSRVPSPIQRPPSSVPSTRALSPPLRTIGGAGGNGRQSVASWISQLANPMPIQSTPKPIALDIPLSAPGGSPSQSVTTMDEDDKQNQKHLGENEKGYESVLKLPVPTWPVSDSDHEKGYGEIPNIPTEPASPGSGSRRSKARSFVGGFVTSLRSIPRAVTHSSVYDRRTTGMSQESSGQSHTDSQAFSGHGIPVHPQLWYRVPPPPLASLEHGQFKHPHHVPILLAHPHAPPPPGITLPHFPGAVGSRRRPSIANSDSQYTQSKYDDYDHSNSSGGKSVSSRLGEFLGELSSMPWISPDRVAQDYVPGETSRSRVTRNGSNGSWYSINPPGTPSDISKDHRWKYVPEPWFPPAQLPTTQEEDEHEDEDESHRVKSGQGDGTTEEKLARVQAELQEKTRELESMRQVVEHQKRHIGALEAEIEELRDNGQGTDIRRWRSSTRKSLSVVGYRKRDSVRTVRSAVRKASGSRPATATSYYDD